MAAIVRATRDGRLAAEVAVVITPSEDAPAFELANSLQLPTRVVPPDDNYGVRLLEALDGVHIVCLAGFMRLLPTEVLDRFRGRVLNIHPALLPKFGGKGMYGMHVHRAVLQAGDLETGCSVHLVSDEYDEGPVVLQKRCAVLPDDTPETLAARVQALEHVAYPEAILMLMQRVGLIENRPQ
jgi:phosphoribosylglycinamide formyltransferase 1